VVIQAGSTYRPHPMDVEELPRVFGEVVRDLRHRHGISQENLAAAAGVDRAYMGGIERGIRNPSLTTIARVARGLGMPLTEVFKAVEKVQK
jgi:transcriptional regulator with XRE-family HTH domain